MGKILQSVPDWCFYPKVQAADYYQRLREMGYDAVEMTPEQRWPEARAAGLKILNQSGPGMQKGLNRREHHAELLPQIKKLVKQAGANGIAQVIVFSGNREGQEDELGVENCVGALKQLAPVAEAAGVELLLELLNGYNHPDYQCDHFGYAAAVVRKVKSPRVRILYDIYHAHRMGEDVRRVILENLPLIGHLHVAGSPKRDFPGAEQAIDYRGLVREVMAAGYKGYWGQEFLPQANALEELKRAHDLFATYG